MQNVFRDSLSFFLKITKQWLAILFLEPKPYESCYQNFFSNVNGTKRTDQRKRCENDTQKAQTETCFNFLYWGHPRSNGHECERHSVIPIYTTTWMSGSPCWHAQVLYFIVCYFCALISFRTVGRCRVFEFFLCS